MSKNTGDVLGEYGVTIMINVLRQSMKDLGFNFSESRYKQFQISASAYVLGYRTPIMDDLLSGNMVRVKKKSYRISQHVPPKNKFYRSKIPSSDLVMIEATVEEDEDIRDRMIVKL